MLTSAVTCKQGRLHENEIEELLQTRNVTALTKAFPSDLGLIRFNKT